MEELRAIWLLGGLAAGALLIAAWAMARGRAAVSSQQRLVEAVQDLGAGELGRRLGEDEVGTAAAAAFNQSARNLDLRQDESRRTVDRLRALAASMADRVILSLNVEDEVEEVLGDLQKLTGHVPALVTGRHASFFFASETEWEKLNEGDGEPAEVVLRYQDGELRPGWVRLVRRSDDHAHLQMLAARPEQQPGMAAEGEAEMGVETPGETAVEGEVAPAVAPETAESRFAAFAGALPDGLAVLAGGRVASASPRLLSMMGTTADEVLGRPLMELVVPADAVSAAALVDAQGRPAAGETELRFRRPHGQAVTLALTVGVLEVEGRMFSILAARDVSQSRSRRRRLEHSAAWLGAALEASSDGLAVMPAGESRPAVANDRFLGLMGLEPDRLPGPARLAEGIQRRFADPEAVLGFVKGDEETDAAHATFVTTDQPARSLQLTRLPVSDRSGRSQGTLLVLRDISDERHARELLMERLDELEQSSSSSREECLRLESQQADLESEAGRLTRENQELRLKDEMKTKMLGNFTHEMQNPMVSIRGYNEMMLRGDLGDISPEQREGLEIALRNAKRLAALVDQLIISARTEEALSELVLESFPVWTLLEENIALLGDRVKEKGLQVTTSYDTQRLNVLADRTLLGQVFSNLLGNAVKYSRQDGTVAVTVRSGMEGELVLEVRDNGVGIPRDEQDRIFQRGFRASTAGESRGSGIGLALVDEILKRHGCQIRVESEPGQGTMFRFTLPLAPDDEDADPGTGAAGDAGDRWR